MGLLVELSLKREYLSCRPPSSGGRGAPLLALFLLFRQTVDCRNNVPPVRREHDSDKDNAEGKALQRLRDVVIHIELRSDVLDGFMEGVLPREADQEAEGHHAVTNALLDVRRNGLHVRNLIDDDDRGYTRESDDHCGHDLSPNVRPIQTLTEVIALPRDSGQAAPCKGESKETLADIQ